MASLVDVEKIIAMDDAFPTTAGSRDKCIVALAEMRAEYTRGELQREDLRNDPMEQFAAWFEEAWKAGIREPNAMSLATASAGGKPSLHTVLLKNYDARGFVFFTNLQSRKARETAVKARVALLFPWLALERQVIITGAAERISAAQTLKYFLTRPRGSQLAAWISKQSSVISSRKVLEMEWVQMKRKFAEGQVPLPSFWGGSRVKPREIEFWQGGVHRLRDRFLYTRQKDGGWNIERLAP
jgi:pyridoxamine 5'-phosphate oxidase